MSSTAGLHHWCEPRLIAGLIRGVSPTLRTGSTASSVPRRTADMGPRQHGTCGDRPSVVSAVRGSRCGVGSTRPLPEVRLGRPRCRRPLAVATWARHGRRFPRFRKSCRSVPGFPPQTEPRPSCPERSSDTWFQSPPNPSGPRRPRIRRNWCPSLVLGTYRP